MFSPFLKRNWFIFLFEETKLSWQEWLHLLKLVNRMFTKSNYTRQDPGFNFHQTKCLNLKSRLCEVRNIFWWRYKIITFSAMVGSELKSNEILYLFVLVWKEISWPDVIDDITLELTSILDRHASLPINTRLEHPMIILSKQNVK